MFGKLIYEYILFLFFQFSIFNFNSAILQFSVFFLSNQSEDPFQFKLLYRFQNKIFLFLF